ncbi:MAG: hypothetical protein KKD63_01850 [Proteobacteria bacterium]|nr:hypothetical protein [Desulfobulbaceae bacterium]MBU4151603.1 hypothetical protein [Pseudomonadota bacterium]
MDGDKTVTELMALLDLKGRRNFKYTYLDPALNAKLIEMTQPDSPNSPTQKYRLTPAGQQFIKVIGAGDQGVGGVFLNG